MSVFSKIGFHPADILIPENCEMSKWSVIACDQYTSEPEYWQNVRDLVGNSPSTLHMMLPEIYLESADSAKMIDNIRLTMTEYISKDLFIKLNSSMVYVERTISNGSTRKGIVGMVDLEKYDFNKGSKTLIRATEGTVLERIPPRVRVRQNAPLELPHVMLLIDDPDNTVIGQLSQSIPETNKIYDFELMQNSGHIKGYHITGEVLIKIAEALDNLTSHSVYTEKYQVDSENPLLFAVGDGNHSLATAKQCYLDIKNKIGEKALDHPARFALVEVVNLHDPSLVFEPIHRVVFDIDPDHCLNELKKFYPQSVSGREQGHQVEFITSNKRGYITIKGSDSELAVGALQKFLDYYTAEFKGKIDYIHGEDVVNQLSSRKNNLGFVLPAMDKSSLFKTVILDGALPRKTFSMGEAKDKRFYLECRKIV